MAGDAKLWYDDNGLKDKRITNFIKLVLYLWNVGWFSYIWLTFYVDFMFDTYKALGSAVTVLIYFLIYSGLCSVYKAFRIASTDIIETVFSQTISFGIADLISWVEACLVWNQYINVFPGLRTFLLQLVGTTLIVSLAKQFFMRHVPPRPTLLIFGDMATFEDAEFFKRRLLEKYRHIFRIDDVAHETMPWDHLKELVDRNEVVLLYSVSPQVRKRFMELCIERERDFYFTPGIEDILCEGTSAKHLLDTPLLKYDYTYRRQGYRIVKRIMDIIFSVFFLLLLSPVMLVTAIAIKVQDSGPVFFVQERCTRDARIFKILKFRSMVVDAEAHGAKPSTEDDDRITRVGRTIRKYRIDEIPQFINILKGDMSFVGPRPERIEHVEQYTKELPEFRYRLHVKGGLTGYAQIFGKYNTSAYDKLRLDLMYIENQSLLLDLKLVLLTIRTVFQKESTEGFAKEQSRRMNRAVQNDQTRA